MEIQQNVFNKNPHQGDNITEHHNIDLSQYTHDHVTSEKTPLTYVEIVGQKKTEKYIDTVKDISFFKLFRYASKMDIFLMIIGSIAACINGFTIPLFSLIFGQLADSFGPSSSGDDLVRAAGQQSIYFTYLGIGSFFLSWVTQFQQLLTLLILLCIFGKIMMSTWMICGERQAIIFRKEYFKAIMNQEVGWFDLINPNELSTKIASECFQIQGAIGEKVSTFLQTICMSLGGFSIGYVRGWEMALVSTAGLPMLAVGAIAFTLVIQTSEKKIAQSYTKAGGLAEQGLNAIKTVKSLTGEEFELKNYKTSLVQAFKVACKYGLWAGIGIGLSISTMFLNYSLSFWYGSTLIDNKVMNTTYNRVYTQSDVFVVFFTIMIGGFSIGQMSPCMKNFAIGRQAGARVFQVIDRKPTIIVPRNAQTISNLQGNIVFDNVYFNYPAKADIPVLRGLKLTFNSNEKTALVGESGCGKSTIMQLLLRFYDPNSGQVIIDGKNVKDLDFQWLRRSVGYVGQEPVLFATSIRENLKFGKDDATEEQMIEALKEADVWEFVKNLEKQLDTFVGNEGGQMSGGQKQRICIARAILKNPQILLLDEATSSLDRQSEATIQNTLDEISKGRTTIVIAHRLTTVRNADRILVIDQGQLVEEGTYEQLIQGKGKFEALAKNQIQKEIEDISKGKGDNYRVQEVESQYFTQEASKKVLKVNNNELGKEEIPKKILSKEELQKQKLEEQGMLKRLYKINNPEKKYLYFGSLFALISGVIFPVSGFLLGDFVDILSKPNSSDFRQRSDMVSFYFLLLAIGAQVFTSLQIYLFTRVGEGLTLRMRQDVYKKMLRMPGEWFDKPENNPGILSARLSTDAYQINGLTSNIISIQLQNVSSLVSGLAIAFTMSWRVSLITLAMSPLILFSGYVQAKYVQGFSETTDIVYKDSGVIITNSVTNIRTVASFSNEKKILDFYSEKLKKPYDLVSKKGNISGITFGFSQLSMFGIYAVIFFCGAIFVRDYGVSIQEMLVSIFAILFAAVGAGNNVPFMSDVGQAKTASKNLFKIIDSEDEIQISEKKHPNPCVQRVKGDIEFRNVSFKYPTRDAQVFQNLSFFIKQGQKVAFVGPSGAGKSSIIQLLLRFYDNYEGHIFIDGKDIQTMDVKEYRKSFGVVSQEPILFNGTITENIKYNNEDITFEVVKEAAHKANALKFIESNAFDSINPHDNEMNHGSGFDRKVGSKGSQLSGGQKQRIAIARAIIKNPNILLLDEATSALDYENEKIVQEALNLFMKGKTSISIAHRLSTIKDSDQIFVIEQGKIVEQGTYDELMSKKAYFYRLNAH